MNTLINPFLESATHFSFIAYRGGNLNERLVNTMNCGDPPIEKSVWYPSQTDLVLIQKPWSDGWLGWRWQDIRMTNLKWATHEDSADYTGSAQFSTASSFGTHNPAARTQPVLPSPEFIVILKEVPK